MENDQPPMTASLAPVALVAVALATNFLWFELALQGPWPSGEMPGGFDELTIYLVGLVIAASLGCALPQGCARLARRLMLLACVLGSLASAALAFSGSASAFVNSTTLVLTGVANVLALMAGTVLLSQMASRLQMGATVVAVFALRGPAFYAVSTLMPEAAQRALLVVLPVMCGACLLAGESLSGRGTPQQSVTKFEPPVSTVMRALLVLASALFAFTASSSAFAQWRYGEILGIAPHVVVIGAAAFSALAYAVLVRTGADLLMRFLPGLVTLLVANTLLALNANVPAAQGASEAVTVFAFYTEVFCEAYSWMLMLYAARTLPTPPWRVVGMFLALEGFIELALRNLGAQGASPGMLTLLELLAAILVLVWVLCQLYRLRGDVIEPTNALAPCQRCPYHATAPTPEVKTAAIPSDKARVQSQTDTSGQHGDHALRAMAAACGLSTRETEVFILLAQGRNRRFICEELFIADGTASTHIGRIYEKLGVHSKQELITLVQSGVSGITAKE